MNVLSLFDGISCGQIALNRAGIKYDKYFASEIDKNAIKVTQHNYPNTIQLGSVVDVKAENLPKIDILFGGSPCQGFSSAGKGLNFKDPRSKLFFEYVRLLKECQPKYFLLENVRMKKEHQDVISRYLGVEPALIDSRDFSCQSRKRLYWTNLLISPYQKTSFAANSIIGESFLTKKELKAVDLSKMDFKGFKTSNSKARIIKNTRGKDELVNCLTSSNTSNPAGCGCSNFVFYNEAGLLDWRKISRTECELAQTLPANYTSILSDGMAKRAIGNGWTIDVIVHILKNII